MHHSIRLRQRPRRPPAARASAAVIVTAALAVAAACSGGTNGSRVASAGTSSAKGSASPSSSASASTVAYSRCVRNHGVPRYPDPDSHGNLPKGTAQAFGVSDSQYQAAERTCRHLLPSNDSTFQAALIQCLMNGNGDCPPALVQRALTEGRKFAQCMRNHEVPNWPDPAIDSTGRPSYQIVKAGISIDDTRSPQMLSKIGICENQPGAVLLRQE